MGIRKNSTCRNRRLKKTSAEVKQYQSFINSSSCLPNDTVPLSNEFLQGSAELCSFCEKLDEPNATKRKSAKYLFTDWLKEHIFPTIITSVLIAVCGAIISYRVDIAVINQRLEYISTQISQIQEDTVNKELLASKLIEIESKLNSSYSLSLNDIKWQLQQLENALDN